MRKLLFAFFALSCAVAYGKEYQVSSAGEIASLAPLPGDVVTFADGEYRNCRINVTFSGTKGAPVVFKAETPGGVRFCGVSSMTIDGRYLDVSGFVFEKPSGELSVTCLLGSGSRFVKFHDCAFGGDECSMDNRKYTTWLMVKGHGNEVFNCSFVGKRNKGLMFDVRFNEETNKVNPSPDEYLAPACLVHNNYFSRPYSRKNEKGQSVNGQESFRIGLSQTSMQNADCRVWDNWFYECDGEIEVISGKCSGNVYEHNLLENCSGEITQRHGKNCVFRRNIIISDGRKSSGGIRIIGSGHIVEENYIEGTGGHAVTAAISVICGNAETPKLAEYWPAHDCTVRGNVIIGCNEGIAINAKTAFAPAVPPRGLRIERNVLKNCRMAVKVYEGMDWRSVRWRGNHFEGQQQGCSVKSVKPKAMESNLIVMRR